MEKKYICTHDNGSRYTSFTFWSDNRAGSSGNREAAKAAYWRLYGKNLHDENIIRIDRCYE